MVVLNKFPVGLFGVFFTQHEALPGAVGDARLLPKIIVIGGVAVRSRTVGTAARFDLKQSQVHPHLDDLSAACSLDQSGLNDAGLEIPALQSVINVLAHGGIFSSPKVPLPSF